MIRFTELIDKLPYPPKLRSKIIQYHSDVLVYAENNYTGYKKFKQSVTEALNKLAYLVIVGQDIPENWDHKHPLENLPDVSVSELQSKLHELYLIPSAIKWDISIIDDVLKNFNEVTDVAVKEAPKSSSTQKSKTTTVVEAVVPAVGPTQCAIPNYDKLSDIDESEEVENPTPYEDIYPTPPPIARLDYSRKYISKTIYGKEYCIYYSLPEVPTKQCEISITTDVNKMTDSELLSLFPNRYLCCRSSLDVPFEGTDYDKDLGIIPKITGFTREQVIDNIIKYPSLPFKLFRRVGKDARTKENRLVKFVNFIELDGKVYPIKDVIDEIEDLQGIQYQPYVSDYILRRYLLERDVKHIDHRVKMYEEIQPWHTLNRTVEQYARFGYKNAVEMARQCVKSRVALIEHCNPVLRRIKEDE